MVSEVPEGEPSISLETAPADEALALTGFDDLYRAEYEPMVRLARGLVDAPEIAEEIAQGRLRQGVRALEPPSTSPAATCAPRW